DRDRDDGRSPRRPRRSVGTDRAAAGRDQAHLPRRRRGRRGAHGGAAPGPGGARPRGDRWDRARSRGGFRAAVEGLVRFPTGELARPDRVLAIGTGDGQTDVEFRLPADLGARRWGLRGEGMYNRQLAADYVLRVAPPTQ